MTLFNRSGGRMAESFYVLDLKSSGPWFQFSSYLDLFSVVCEFNPLTP